MATIDLVKIKLNGDTGGGGKPAILESLSVSENGVYVPSEGVDGYNQVNVNVQPSDNYSYYDGGVDVEGLRAIGWSDESIGMLRDNTPHYSWQNDEFIVSEENKSLYGVVTSYNIDDYRENPDLEFLPNITLRVGYYGGSNFRYIKAFPKTIVLDGYELHRTFQSNPKLLTIPYFDTSNATKMYEMFYNCTSLQSIPLLNTSNVTTMYSMFQNCSSLKTIPLLDTSNVTSMSNMFYNCITLQTIPLFNTSNVTYMRNMFTNCLALTTIPLIDTSKVTDMYYMFYGCDSLTTIPLLDTSKVTNMNGMFNNCSSLQSLPLLDCSSVTNIGYFFFNQITTLTDLGGFKNLKIDWNDNYGLAKLPNLTYQSVMNVINNLYDFRGNGDTTTTRTIKFNASSKALLSDEDIAIATAKGWVIS